MAGAPRVGSLTGGRVMRRPDRYDPPIPDFDPSPWFFAPMLGGFALVIALLLKGLF